MPYVTGDEVIARHSVLKNWNYGATSVSSDLIYFAEAEINGRLSGPYTTPFSVAHPTVKDLTIELSYLKALYSKNLAEWEIRNEAFEARMTRLINGEESIFTGSDSIRSAGGIPWSSTKDYHPTFSMLDAEDPLSMVDSDLIEALVDERS